MVRSCRSKRLSPRPLSTHNGYRLDEPSSPKPDEHADPSSLLQVNPGVDYELCIDRPQPASHLQYALAEVEQLGAARRRLHATRA
jgi:hypothetical protein